MKRNGSWWAGAAALAIGIACGAAEAVSKAGPTVKTGMSYASARAALIGDGFRPVPSGDRDADRCSAGRQDVCAAYPETVSCSGTGHAECRFIFAGPKGAGMTLEADGPDVGRLKVTAVRKSTQSDVNWQKR